MIPLTTFNNYDGTSMLHFTLESESLETGKILQFLSKEILGKTKKNKKARKWSSSMPASQTYSYIQNS